MIVLQAGGGVVILRFLPDGRRLLAGVTVPASGRWDDATIRFAVLPLAGGPPVALDLPPLPRQAWYRGAESGNPVAIHPDGRRVFIAWGGELHVCRADDGQPLSSPADAGGHQIAVSPDGRRVLVADLTYGHKRMTCLADDLSIDWVHPLTDATRHLAGFAVDGEAVVTVGDGIRVWSAINFGGPTAATAWSNLLCTHRPAVSPDGRYFGVVGSTNLYLYELPPLRWKGQIPAYRMSIKVADWVFHPGGRFLAAILNAPSLVKLYDLGTMKLTRKFNWKLGPLNAVAFSPDGALAAAGSADGRIVVWDVDL